MLGCPLSPVLALKDSSSFKIQLSHCLQEGFLIYPSSWVTSSSLSSGSPQPPGILPSSHLPHWFSRDCANLRALKRKDHFLSISLSHVPCREDSGGLLIEECSSFLGWEGLSDVILVVLRLPHKWRCWCMKGKDSLIHSHTVYCPHRLCPCACAGKQTSIASPPNPVQANCPFLSSGPNSLSHPPPVALEVEKRQSNEPVWNLLLFAIRAERGLLQPVEGT